MFKILNADKDTYITDRVIGGKRVTNANVGSAGSLDLYKLYGITTSGSQPNIELSRLLIHFDLSSLRELHETNKIDITNSSFNCKLKLFDVYGGQTTPNNFIVTVNPLSRSFDEGQGRDIIHYADIDTTNYLSSSRTDGAWHISGSGLGGWATSACDYITSSAAINDGELLTVQQQFVSGEEDLYVDVTKIISATITNQLPDAGFRISLHETLEHNNRTYFVKRFASRTAYNSSKHPQLILRFDDSIQDDSQNLNFGVSGSIFLYNYENNRLSNLRSGSTETPIVGSDCLLLKLTTSVSGGVYELVFTGSQHTLGIHTVAGVYSASIIVPNPIQQTPLSDCLQKSGSIEFTPIWHSLDNSLSYHTGSTIRVYPTQRNSTLLNSKYVITVSNVQDEYVDDEIVLLRLNIFDASSPKLLLKKLPIISKGVVIRDVHYQIRDAITSQTLIPFDYDYNSTRVSSDYDGMYFNVDMSNLPTGRTYVIDVCLLTDNKQIYRSVSKTFKVINTNTQVV